MTEPPIEDNPSDDVLEELLGAFSVDSSADGADESTGDQPEKYDFDDPSIDRLLGIAPDAPTVVAPVVIPKVESVSSAPAPSDKGKLQKVEPPTPKAAKVKPEKVKKSKNKEAAERATIVIGADELPDAVYLDVEREEKFLERRTEEGNKDRSTIVITDFDDVAAVDASAVRSTLGGGDRIRARRISVRRAEGRRRLRWVAIGLAAVAIPVATLAVLASPLFDVSEVSVQGATYTDAALLASIVDEITGDPVLLVDTMELEQRLRADPWVESVKVETDFPHRVIIDIRERKPVAAFQGGDGRFRIIDYEGRVLDVIDGIPIDYMLITGDHPDTTRGQFAGAPYSATAQLVLGLPSEIRSITESVSLNAATGALALQFTGDTLVQLGDASNMDEKLARLLSVVRGGLDGICQIDVSTREVGSVPC
ncbi:MAG: FtsQ-type POTRA domain-containing protein [Ilumatobacteraceae bacterium]